MSALLMELESFVIKSSSRVLDEAVSSSPRLVNKLPFGQFSEVSLLITEALLYIPKICRSLSLRKLSRSRHLALKISTLL